MFVSLSISNIHLFKNGRQIIFFSKCPHSSDHYCQSWWYQSIPWSTIKQSLWLLLKVAQSREKTKKKPEGRRFHTIYPSSHPFSSSMIFAQPGCWYPSRLQQEMLRMHETREMNNNYQGGREGKKLNQEDRVLPDSHLLVLLHCKLYHMIL